MINKAFHFTAIFLLSFIFSTTESTAQGLDAGIGIGGSGYYGDLDTDDFFKDAFNLGLAVEIEGTYQYNRWLAGTLSFAYANIRANDLNRPVDDPERLRNLNFKSTVLELGLMAEFHFLGNSDLQDPLPVSPYLTLGVAGYSFNPKAENQDQTYSLKELRTEGQGLEGYDSPYKTLGVSIPAGLGIKIRLPHPFALKVDVIGRYTFTDHLDDVSGNYVDKGLLIENAGILSPVFSDRRETPTYEGVRGSGDSNDIYFTVMVTFVYNIFNSGRNGIFCPTVEKPEF